ncbi:S100P-binding protein isoform X2 [Paralichthys olivaceus]|uniref:S100P-binding protein isoform X2 n=1 Tax=Paralichthys olivaceus TaxID=8255 RepID=UPI003753DAEC
MINMDERMNGPFRSTVFSMLTPALFDSFTDPCSPPLTVPLHSHHLECGSLTGPGVNMGTLINSEREEFNVVSTFDCDVDNILCLNQVGVGGFSENVESCRSSDTFQKKHILSSTWTSDGGSVAHHQELESGNDQVEDGREGLKKELYLNVSDEEYDDGYLSMFHKRAKNSPQSGYIQLPRATSRATSSPQHWTDEVREPWGACHPESSSEQAEISRRHNSFTVSDLCPTVSGATLDSANSDSLEGDIEEEWTIGRPIFESSMCHSVTLKLIAGSEQSRQVTEDVQQGVTKPIRDCQDTGRRDKATAQSTDTSYETGYETTLSPQVQVKSVVVAPRQSTTSSSSSSSSSSSNRSKTTASSVPELEDSNRCVQSGKRKRPEDMDMDWESRKQSYVHSVTKHMQEHPGTTQDVMTELFNLITHVAKNTRGANGRQWQHPSDLTHRNYQRHFGNMTARMSLNEWQEKNSKTYKRFANVPKIFERNPFP